MEQDLDFIRISEDIRARNYAQIPNPVTQEELEEVAGSFIHGFLTLPTEVKQLFHGEVDASRKGSDIGYVGRSKDRGNFDDKEFFHYNRHVEDQLGEVISLSRIAELDNFLGKVRPLYEKVETSAQTILTAADSMHPGIYGRFFQDGVNPNLFLRVLAYLRTEAGGILAVDHYDRGTFTLALGESSSGLRMGSHPYDMQDVEYRDGKALFFKGKQDIPGIDLNLPPGWHGVMQRPEQDYSELVPRWAVVCFIDQLAVGNVTTQETHTPISYK